MGAEQVGSLMASTTVDSILETPLSPLTAALLQPASPSPSPPNLGRKTSLIDLKDWVVDDGPTPTQKAFTPLITLGSPPRPKPKPANLSAAFKTPPQLPPRKPSYTSLKSVPSRQDSLTVEHAHRYPPLALDLNSRPKNSSGHVQSSSVSSFHSVSLSSDTDPSTPGSVANFIATFPMDEEHHRKNGDADSISLSESYEEVSTSSLASPATERLITLDWEKAMAKRKVIPPKLPERPKSATTRVTHQRSTPSHSHPISRTASTSGSSPSSPDIRPAISPASSSSTLAYTPRRAAPPPPPSRSSDRSSIQSTATTNSYSSSSQSHHSRANPVPSVVNPKVKRPTPVPLGVRKRYEVVFNANIIQRRKAEKRRLEEKPTHLSPVEARARRAAGWRGLSVDLITGDDSLSAQPQEPVRHDGDKVDQEVDQDEKLEGPIVRLIWERSRLDSARLSDIWYYSLFFSFDAFSCH